MEFNNWLNLFCLLFIIFLKIKIANLFPTMLKVLLIGQHFNVASVRDIVTFVTGAIGMPRLVTLPAFLLMIMVGTFWLYTYLLIVSYVYVPITINS